MPSVVRQRDVGARIVRTRHVATSPAPIEDSAPEDTAQKTSQTQVLVGELVSIGCADSQEACIPLAGADPSGRPEAISDKSRSGDTSPALSEDEQSSDLEDDLPPRKYLRVRTHKIPTPWKGPPPNTQVRQGKDGFAVHERRILTKPSPLTSARHHKSHRKTPSRPGARIWVCLDITGGPLPDVMFLQADAELETINELTEHMEVVSEGFQDLDDNLEAAVADDDDFGCSANETQVDEHADTGLVPQAVDLDPNASDADKPGTHHSDSNHSEERSPLIESNEDPKADTPMRLAPASAKVVRQQDVKEPPKFDLRLDPNNFSPRNLHVGKDYECPPSRQRPRNTHIADDSRSIDHQPEVDTALIPADEGPAHGFAHVSQELPEVVARELALPSNEYDGPDLEHYTQTIPDDEFGTGDRLDDGFSEDENQWIASSPPSRFPGLVDDEMSVCMHDVPDVLGSVRANEDSYALPCSPDDAHEYIHMPIDNVKHAPVGDTNPRRPTMQVKQCNPLSTTVIAKPNAYHPEDKENAPPSNQQQSRAQETSPAGNDISPVTCRRGLHRSGSVLRVQASPRKPGLLIAQQRGGYSMSPLKRF